MKLARAAMGASAAFLLGLATAATAGVVSYQGRVALGGSPYSGPGYFKFAVVDAAGTTTLWSNDGTSVAGSQPTAGVTLVVTDGLFDVLLGDATLPNMTDLPGSAFPIGGAVRMLRAWFSTTNAPGSFTQLAPDRRVASVPMALQAGRTIPFSTGTILSGATVVSAAPIVMGFGSHTVQVVDGSGESTSPPEEAGFSFPVPASGVLQDLQISADLLVASVASINVTPLTYVFTVFRAPSVPNTGSQHPASPYVTTALTSSVTFAGPGLVAGTFYAATNASPGSLAVSAGDRIGVRVRTSQPSDPSAADITQLSFSASLTYTPN